VAVEVKGRPRPPLREKGFTHFIHIPLVDACRDIYENMIKAVIDPNDQDALVDLGTLHATIMVFRMKSEADIPRWQKLLYSLKLRKVKLTLKGVGIFPVKPNTNFTRVFYIKVGGLEDLIHEVVQKAVSQELISEDELSNIVLDKKTDMYKAEQPHLTLLKTKNNDIIDATTYLKQLAKLNIPRPVFSDIRLSVIGSFDGEGYFDEVVAPVDK
jgi:2'-5' RNA ligase